MITRPHSGSRSRHARWWTGSSLGSSLSLVALAVGLAACSSFGSTASSSTPAAPTTSVADTTSTTEVATTTTEPETTTTEAPAPVYPLTGLPAVDPAIASRPALVVKIDNAPGARPQTGFNEADIVFEEIVNDNLTRFAMVFQSNDSNPVGPIRSGRLQDIDLFSMFNHPLFAWSGGNATVTAAIRASDLVDIGPARVPAYYRSGDRSVPHNLYSSTEKLREFTPVFAGPPPQQFEYRAEGEAPAGEPSPGVAVKLDAIDVSWAWDPATNLYRRTMEGRAHTDAATGDQVTTDNVVVIVVEYKDGISHSPDAQTIGTGEAFVLSGGNAVHGTWSRADRLQPYTLTDDSGNPIELTPGRTFVELPRPGNTLVLPAT